MLIISGQTETCLIGYINAINFLECDTMGWRSKPKGCPEDGDGEERAFNI
jgi:hypothetical protein